MNQTVLQEFLRGSQYFLQSGKVVAEICHKILLLLLSTAKKLYKNLQRKLSSAIVSMHYPIHYLNICFSRVSPLTAIYRENFI